MKPMKFTVASGVLALCVSAAVATPPSGFAPLFDGTEPGFGAHWSMAGDTIRFDGAGDIPNLASAKSYGDIDLWIDWRIQPGGDSGIYLRGQPQVQIWADASGSGGLYNNQKSPNAPLARADRPAGQWNRFHIVQRGDRTWVWLNDTLVTDGLALENIADRSAPLAARGTIELQSHGTPLEFRNCVVREASSDSASATQQAHDQRMGWWRDARFGMFIHWGLYAIPAGAWQGKDIGGAGEWLLDHAKIKPVDYFPLREQFNPVRFEAEEWVRVAKAAGQRYIVITSKHHDGFCLWDTQQTKWGVMHSPFKRDILKELARACERGGIRLCFYHSIMDWTHPDYLPRRAWDDRPADKESYDTYVAYMKEQLRELLSGEYGDIGILWFDGEWEDTWTHERGKDLAAFVRSLDSDIIINNRVDKGRGGMGGFDAAGEWEGDYGTPEQQIPATGAPGVDWETCMTMNETWGFVAKDNSWKSVKVLLQNLVDIASKGGNYLLNVGPQADGLIPAASIERLSAIGDWMETNGESIYGTDASPFTKLAFGRCTQKALPLEKTRLYFHMFDWPKASDGYSTLTVSGLRNEVLAARLLGATGTSVSFQRGPDGQTWLFTLPTTAPDENDSVLAVDIAGAPAVEPTLIQPDAAGVVSLLAPEAALRGSVQYEARFSNLGYWTGLDGTAEWNFSAPAGRYELEAVLAAPSGEGGGAFEVDIDGVKVAHDAPVTDGWGDFKPVSLGSITLESMDSRRCIVRATRKPNGALMNLKSLTLRPTGAP